MSMAKLIRTAFILIVLTIASPSRVNADFIVSLSLTNVSENYAVAKWKTEKMSTGTVVFGLVDNQMHSQSHSIGEATNHQVLLSQLKKGTTYFYQLITKSTNGQEYRSTIRTFRTLGEPDLILIENQVLDISKDSAKIRWKVNKKVLARLIYIQDGTREKLVSETGKESMQGDFQVDKLLPATRYFYFISFIDNNSITNNSEVGVIQTLENNLALGRKVSGTFNKFVDNDSYFDRTPKPENRMTDGSINYFKGLSVSGQIQSNDQYCIIDLESVSTVSKVRVYWRALAYSRNYDLETSVDGKVWKTAATAIDAEKVERTYENGNPCRVVETRFPAQQARYVKLIARKGSYFVKHKTWTFVQIYEIKIFP